MLAGDIFAWSETIIISKIRVAASRIDYRHPLTLSISVTATVCFILVASLLVWLTYANRSMRKHYEVKSLKDIGLKAALSTERIDDSVHYIFGAKPISDETKDRFDDVIRKRGESVNFVLTLEDDGGFELCHATVSWQPTLGDQGKFVALSGRGVISDCPVRRYAQSKKWGISFSYPSITESLSPEVAKTEHQEQEKTTKPRSEAGMSAVTDDTLTGADIVSGGIETLSGRSFRVIRGAEKMTLLPWQSSDKLAISCEQTSCLITDSSNGQSVHARLVQ